MEETNRMDTTRKDEFQLRNGRKYFQTMAESSAIDTKNNWCGSNWALSATDDWRPVWDEQWEGVVGVTSRSIRPDVGERNNYGHEARTHRSHH